LSSSILSWNNDLEPNQVGIRAWLDNLYTKFQPLEQARWNESNIDSLFYAGAQSEINRHFNFTPSYNHQSYYFNLIQQPINMVTGYQRQHRKSINYIPSEGADPQTTDQYTRIIDHVANVEGINEQISRACELAAVSGMVLVQPYLDYMGSDPAQGALKLKIWEYNSFLVDPYFRSPDMSDAQFVWCQEHISKKEAEGRFPDKIEQITPLSGSPQRYGRFYFLPENYNLARNDLLVLSYVWYKWKHKKKRLYSRTRNQFFDFAGGQENMDRILYGIEDMEAVEVEVPTWKLAVVLNDQLMFQGNNPLGFDDCPFVPFYWNYEPHISYPDLRVRSLTRTMRSSQFLLNRQIIISHDQKEATINAGYKRKVGAVANEDNLKKPGQGWDVLINEGYEMGDFEKIMPNAVPESDFALADRLMQMIYSTSGVNIENWSAQEDGQVSGLTVLLKQGANLMVLQKYFDQWDLSLKITGERLLQIVLNNWNAQKVGLIIGEEPTPFFFSRIFSRYQVIVEEGLNTATQRQQEFRQTLDLNQVLGGIIPASYIASIATLQGKHKLMQVLQQQEAQQAATAQEGTTIQHAFQEAQLKELYAKAANQLAMARERHSRSQSDVGLFEERLAEVEKNHALSLKAKMEAVKTIIEAANLMGGGTEGEAKADKEIDKVESIGDRQRAESDSEKIAAKRSSEADRFVSEMLAGIGSN
jgi:hypothetical protein